MEISSNINQFKKVVAQTNLVTVLEKDFIVNLLDLQESYFINLIKSKLVQGSSSTLTQRHHPHHRIPLILQSIMTSLITKSSSVLENFVSVHPAHSLSLSSLISGSSSQYQYNGSVCNV